MVKGYLLLKLFPGFESEAISQVRATYGVVEVNLVFGQWDAIAMAEAKNLFESQDSGGSGAGYTGCAGHYNPGARRAIGDYFGIRGNG